jgi:hypothetical protein
MVTEFGSILKSMPFRPGIEFDPTPIIRATSSGPYDNVPDLIGGMTRLGPALVDAGMPHLSSFNDLYLALTKRVYYDATHDTYEDPDTVLHTMPIFDDLFENPLRQFALDNLDEVPESWYYAFSSLLMRLADPTSQFASCMGTHIQADLPVATELSGVPDSYEYDYTWGVGGSIKKVIQEKAPYYLPGSGKVRDLEARCVDHWIAGLRGTAWVDKDRIKQARALSIIAPAIGKQALEEIRRELDLTAKRTSQVFTTVGTLAFRGVSLFSPPQPIPAVAYQ